MFVHQLLKYWVSPGNDVAVTLVLRYELPGLATREAPSSERQFVALTRLRHGLTLVIDRMPSTRSAPQAHRADFAAIDMQIFGLR